MGWLQVDSRNQWRWRFPLMISRVKTISNSNEWQRGNLLTPVDEMKRWHFFNDESGILGKKYFSPCLRAEKSSAEPTIVVKSCWEVCGHQITSHLIRNYFYHVFMENIAYLTTENRYMVRLTGNCCYSFRKHPTFSFARLPKRKYKDVIWTWFQQ